MLSAERLGTDQSVFVVVAIGNRGLLAAGSLLVQRPYTKPTGKRVGVWVCLLVSLWPLIYRSYCGWYSNSRRP